MASHPDVVIVGAGVIGLSTAVRLAERGVRVRVYADRPGRETCSYAAGAMFDPFLAAHEKRSLWADSTRREFERLQEGEKLSSIRLVGGIEASRTPVLPPMALPECSPDELPGGFVVGWRYQVHVIDMPLYMRWLEKRFTDIGGTIVRRRLETLDEGFDDADIVVNCTGIGALSLVPDGSMQPIRGQLVVIRNPGIDQFFAEYTPDLDVSESIYLIPQGPVLLLGGNAEKGEVGAEPDLEVAAAIRHRCEIAFPEIAGQPVIGHRAGIRPQRLTVRLEHQDLGSRHIIHNYGHGGSGVSLSWGCADEAASIALGLLDRSVSPAPGRTDSLRS